MAARFRSRLEGILGKLKQTVTRAGNFSQNTDVQKPFRLCPTCKALGLDGERVDHCPAEAERAVQRERVGSTAGCDEDIVNRRIAMTDQGAYGFRVFFYCRPGKRTVAEGPGEGEVGGEEEGDGGGGEAPRKSRRLQRQTPAEESGYTGREGVLAWLETYENVSNTELRRLRAEAAAEQETPGGGSQESLDDLERLSRAVVFREHACDGSRREQLMDVQGRFIRHGDDRNARIDEIVRLVYGSEFMGGGDHPDGPLPCARELEDADSEDESDDGDWKPKDGEVEDGEEGGGEGGEEGGEEDSEGEEELQADEVEELQADMAKSVVDIAKDGEEGDEEEGGLNVDGYQKGDSTFKKVLDMWEGSHAQGGGLETIVGNDEAVGQLREALVVFKYPEIFSRPPAGLLLYGPPGTGKTSMVRAMAKEAEAIFFNVKASDVVDPYIGKSEQVVSLLYSLARNQAPKPVIIFFDEVESVWGRPDSGPGDACSRRMGSLVNTFKMEMDGFVRGTNVMTIGATNYPWEIDPALGRSGRISTKVCSPTLTLSPCPGPQPLPAPSPSPSHSRSPSRAPSRSMTHATSPDAHPDARPDVPPCHHGHAPVFRFTSACLTKTAGRPCSLTSSRRSTRAASRAASAARRPGRRNPSQVPTWWRWGRR